MIVANAFLKTGGQDRANFALASYLAQRGDPVHVVAHAVGDSLCGPTLARHIATRPIRSDLLGEPFLERLGQRTATRLQPLHPHVIVNGGNCNWSDVNWVHYVHAAYERPLVGGLATRTRWRLSHQRWLKAERRALLNARLVLANSKRTRRDLVGLVGVPAERIRVVYYGTDPEYFRPPRAGERAEIRRRLGWSSDRPVALFIGALGDRRKGFDTAILAWKQLRARGTQPPLLVVVGQGALLQEWQRCVAESGLSDSIVFLGFRNDVPQFVRAADLLVAPTRYEAYGLGVHEALCCGLPAVVSADAGVAERYPPELRHLLLEDPTNPEELASKVDAALSAPSAQVEALNDLATSLRSRTWHDMARELVDVVCER